MTASSVTATHSCEHRAFGSDTRKQKCNCGHSKESAIKCWRWGGTKTCKTSTAVSGDKHVETVHPAPDTRAGDVRHIDARARTRKLS
eukprot:15434489-Alexandrium_andersonii.AAC.1